MNRRELLSIAAGSGTAAILSSASATADSTDDSVDTVESEASGDTVQITVEFR